MIGMVYENGPFVFEHNTTELKFNEYAWNKKANLLYIESPGGVGYSISEKEFHSDATVAEDNLQAMLKFYEKFPTLRKNDLYLSGESYAGIYVPWLAWKILQHNALPSSRDTHILLKGIMVGNACTDPLECSAPGKYGSSIYQYEFLFKHGYYDDLDYDYFKAACLMGDYLEDPCKSVRLKMDQFFASTRTSILNIYGKCYGIPSSDSFDGQPDLEQPATYKRVMKQSGRKQLLRDELDCEDTVGIMDFFNKHGNFERLHVEGTI